MKFSKSLIALAALVAPMSANAAITFGLGNGTQDYLSLSTPGSLGGIATITGGVVYSASEYIAAKPAGDVFENLFLASGPNSPVNGTGVATLDFGAGVDFLSFLWGSPDLFNSVIINGVSHSAADFGINPASGDQGASYYVAIKGDVGEIKTVAFSSPATDAIEVTNFSTAVPEPATWGMMLVGFGAVGSAMRRRRVMKPSFV